MLAYLSRWILPLTLVCTAVAVDPNDPLYENAQKSYFEAIRVPEAWNKAHGVLSQRRATVALIDSGIRADHEDLKGNLVTGYNVMDKNTDTHDRAGHGTAMAGIIGAVTNNGKGIAGITDHISIMPICVYGEIPLADFAKSIDYAINAKVDVILLAAGFEVRSPIIEAALARATQANIPFVCSSGNEGRNISEPGQSRYPCQHSTTSDGVICIAGTREASMNLHVKSNYAPFIDVAAPANAVTTTMSGKYTSVQGTSGSAAIAAAVIAMLKSVAPRSLSVKEIKDIIRTTSTLGVKSYDGTQSMPFGRLDAFKAIEKVLR
ncbi:hypothetical protein FOL47_008117 [Perkinsus chesapeaki]|uniref:subtilisin n=1 Tax=Perkinsus chesapeaki TaxID=330153 RepID=A0A7J6LG35_PERCH|nr:hypothetical protein FOL47_008117 [Perkinsus chesapeaki]